LHETTDTIEIAVGSADQQNADVGYLPGPGEYVAVWQDECEACQERSGWYGSGNADIYGRLVSPEGTLDGSGYAIAAESQDETLPRLSAAGGWPMVVWQRANTGGTGNDLYGRTLWTDGRPADDDPAFTLMEAAGNQESPAVASDGSGRYLVAWQDDRNGDWDIYGVPVQLERVIEYQYDGLYRLTEASYSTGELFGYDYDSVGNRQTMTVTTPPSGTEVTTYTYDAANRLTHVGGVALSWDNNGNLLEDHEGTDYAYDTANRLIQVVQDGVTYTFSYNAPGDRLSQSVGGAVTTYTLDLYGGLTQVLGDGASLYRYGLGRIGEEGAAGWLTHLGDALGSVRQLAAGDGEVVLDRSYRPYGGVLESGGSGASAYGFAGEWTDGTGLVFLRARYMDPRVGRFATRDRLSGSLMLPTTQNLYLYGLSNPVRHTDPSGYCIVQYSGEVRMNEHPYGTSGLCPHTESAHAEAAYAVVAQYYSQIPDWQEGTGAFQPNNNIYSGFQPNNDNYSTFESWMQGIGIGIEWLFEAGPDTRVFGPQDSLTADLMHDIGVRWAWNAYASAGYPNNFYYEYRIDLTGNALLTSVLARWFPEEEAQSYAALLWENAELAVCSWAPFRFGILSSSPEGAIDTIGAALGSYDVYFHEFSPDAVLVMVENASSWQSIARYGDPDDPKYWHRDTERQEWGLYSEFYAVWGAPIVGPTSLGGTVRQLFWWVESRRY
jgi:RHS repeat-associated protein